MWDLCKLSKQWTFIETFFKSGKKVEILRMYLFAPLKRGVVSIPDNLDTVIFAS